MSITDSIFLFIKSNIYFLIFILIAILVKPIRNLLYKLIDFIFSKFLIFLGIEDKKGKVKELFNDFKNPILLIFVRWLLALSRSLNSEIYAYFKTISIDDKILVCIDIIIAMLVFRLLEKRLKSFLFYWKKRLELHNSKVSKSYLFLIPTINNIGRIIMFVALSLFIMNRLGYEYKAFMSGLSKFMAGLSILGIGITFISQETISNFLSGMFILTDKPFAIGDRIQIEEIHGDVIEVGIRTTKIRTLVNTIVTIPNSHITKNSVINYRHINSQIKVYYPIEVSFESDFNKVRDVLYEAIEKNELILKEPKPKVYFSEYKDYGVEFTLIFWITDISEEYKVMDLLNFSIDKIFSYNNIKIPYPTYEVYSHKNNEKQSSI